MRFNHLVDDGYDILECYDCPGCGSTLAIPGIGPVFEEVRPGSVRFKIL
jgi:hypothetical protein